MFLKATSNIYFAYLIMWRMIVSSNKSILKLYLLGPYCLLIKPLNWNYRASRKINWIALLCWIPVFICQMLYVSGYFCFHGLFFCRWYEWNIFLLLVAYSLLLLYIEVLSMSRKIISALDVWVCKHINFI